MADPATSEDAAAPSDKASADAGRSQAPSKVDSTAFANTREHVASKHADGETIERFTNTKLNIALINDPKNGPRFTMTKRESGLDEKDEAASGEETSPPSSEKSATGAPSRRSDKPAPTSEAESAAAPSGEPVRTATDDRLPDPASDHPPDTARPEETEPQAALLTKPAPTDFPPAVEAQPNKATIDSSKTFVGHNGTYYDESWRWMDWRGTRQSWNWPAALSLGHWFAYRRLYTLAGLYLVWLAGLAAAAVNDIPILGLTLLALLVVGLTGVYGNTLYFRAFRRAVSHVTRTGEDSYEEQRDQLAQAGGTSTTALSIMAMLSITGIASALAATYYMRGGFFLNLWPF